MNDLTKRTLDQTVTGGFNLADDLKPGQWYWIKTQERAWDEEKEKYVKQTVEGLWCLIHVGSNYVKAKHPYGGTIRIHFNDFFDRCREAPDWQEHINKRIAACQEEIQKHLQSANALFGGLCLKDTTSGETTQALAAVEDASAGMVRYKDALKDARDKKLPEIFKTTESLQERLGNWIKAPYLPLEATRSTMKKDMKLIDNRLWAVDLYAGLSEGVEHVVKGARASEDDKVHVYQRLRYMDEECITHYNRGGLEFETMEAFDRWVAEQRDVYLPQPKSVVAFRVRREDKYREIRSLADFFHAIWAREMDKKTFLYIRNGENIWRLSTDNKFKERIFPDLGTSIFTSGEPLYWKGEIGSYYCEREDAINSFVTEGAKDQIIADIQEYNAKQTEQWATRSLPRFHRFDETSVFFDDMRKAVAQHLWQHNRVALVLQGIFDRSDLFQPHGKVSLYDPVGFAKALELVYDDSKALNPADMPDFEAFRAKVNSSIKVGSMVTGAGRHWKETMEEKHYEVPRYLESPPTYCRVHQIKPRKKEIVLEWWRTDRTGLKPVRQRHTIPISEVFHLDGYTEGDFRQFYKDPRTRQHYLKWGGLLVTAEKYVEKRDTLPEGETVLGSEYHERAKDLLYNVRQDRQQWYRDQVFPKMSAKGSWYKATDKTVSEIPFSLEEEYNRYCDEGGYNDYKPDPKWPYVVWKADKTG